MSAQQAQHATEKKKYRLPTRLRLTEEVVAAIYELAAAQEPPTDLSEKGAVPMFLRSVILAYRDMVLHRGRYATVCPYCRQELKQTPAGIWECPAGHGQFVPAADES